MKHLESDIQKAILQYLKLKGYMAWRNQTVGIYDKKNGGYRPSMAVGAPDILLVHKGQNGRLWGLEVKGEKGTISEHQKAFGDSLEASGAKYLVVRSVDDCVNAGL